jgi:hypothetical protein
VELHNPGDATVLLDGWQLDDEIDGGGQGLSGQIAPGGLLLIELDRPIMNNSGDTARLLGPDGALVDALAFGPGSDDRSFERDPRTGAAIEQAEPSPGEATRQRPPVATPVPTPAPFVAPGAVPSAAEPVAAPVERRAPQPTVALSRAEGAAAGVRYRLQTATPLATPTAAPTEPTARPQQPAPPASLPWLPLVGLALIMVACGLLLLPEWRGAARDAGDGVL